MTIKLEVILDLARAFDNTKEVSKKLEFRERLLEKMHLLLTMYQDFIFPLEEFPRTKFVVGLKTEGELKKELIKNGKCLNNSSGMIQRTSIKVSPKPEEIEVIGVSLQKLGLLYGNIDQIYKKAAKMGLEICSKEVALLLGLKRIGDTSNKRSGTIAMAPMEDGDVSYFIQIDVHFLNRTIYHSDKNFHPEKIFYFCLKKIGGK